jgi:hypothetical protein
MVGKETDLDKTIIEAIKDPLTHIVRNSVDHGIEPPATRIANGKPAQGVVKLQAFHEGGQINIQIADDGVLRHDGVLFLGSAETTIGIHAGFERETWRKTGFYKQVAA